MHRRFDLLILDLDGTLVDSEALLVGMVNETLVESGYPSADARGVGALIGLPLDEVFSRAAPTAEANAIAELCTRYRLRADAPEFVRQFRLYAGVTPTLAGLHSAGLRLVIATSKRRATTLDILRHCAVDGMIDAVIGGDCVTRGKPHPEMVHRAQAYFPTAVERTVVIGDTRFDIEMGQAAGIATCAVTYGVHAEQELRAAHPDFLIDAFGSLSDVVFDATNHIGARPGSQTP
ncbi:MAG: HAD family hydrolase [Candidatus Binatia bacterium]